MILNFTAECPMFQVGRFLPLQTLPKHLLGEKYFSTDRLDCSKYRLVMRVIRDGFPSHSDETETWTCFHISLMIQTAFQERARPLGCR